MKLTPFKASLAAALLFASCAATSTEAPVELPEPPGSHPFGPRPEVPQLWKNGELVEKHGESEEYRSEDPLEAVGTVLFVGNSFTFWNGGLWTHMQELTAARGEDLGAETSRVVRGGASLRVLWKRTKAKEKISEGGYDVVVLQEDLPETKVSDFHKYAALFDAHTREAGSRLIFFMSWDYERLDWISMDEIITEHKRMAWELDAEVAPCGYAWQRAMAERPEVDFYSGDREHQSWYGTLLNLYVIYSTIYGESPESLEFTPPEKSEVTADEDAWLRRVAWGAYQSWQEEMKERPE